ncbi:MAG TPA: hypothetical protein VFU95_09460 [Telluria sp.]|nr:hypothetical protein [Telluria sp.]
MSTHVVDDLRRTLPQIGAARARIAPHSAADCRKRNSVEKYFSGGRLTLGARDDRGVLQRRHGDRAALQIDFKNTRVLYSAQQIGKVSKWRRKWQHW